MASHNKADVTPQEIEHAQKLWHGFTTLMKIGTIGVIILMALMALFLV